MRATEEGLRTVENRDIPEMTTFIIDHIEIDRPIISKKEIMTDEMIIIRSREDQEAGLQEIKEKKTDHLTEIKGKE